MAKRTKESTIIYLSCNCGCEVMAVEEDIEYDEYYVSLFGSHPELNLWNQIRYIWQILKTGKPYTDQMIITKEKAQELSEFLKGD